MPCMTVARPSSVRRIGVRFGVRLLAMVLDELRVCEVRREGEQEALVTSTRRDLLDCSGASPACWLSRCWLCVMVCTSSCVLGYPFSKVVVTMCRMRNLVCGKKEVK